MSHTVVVRLVDAGDGRLRGVAEDVPTGRRHQFTTEDELVALLRRLTEAGSALA